ncbi:hypothetical protein EBR16_05455 [bacterium]|nr:hypothetical protein [bacterium]
MPKNAHEHHDDGPRNQICIAQPGMETWVRSWVPSGQNFGMVIRHGESYTMCKHLTVKNADGTDAYRPTVHYAYHPSDVAIDSVLELRMRNWKMQDRERILNNEIISGRDELGVLLMGHDYKAWWTGSILDIHEARTKVPNQSATTLQVASSVMAAIKWIIAEPMQGVRVPDELPHEFIIDAAPAEARLLRTAREVNDAKPGHVLARIRAQVPAGAALACLGLAFKANVDDLRESPALDIAVHLAAEGYRVLAVEPHIAALPAGLAGRAELVDLPTALARADAVVLLVDHRAFGALTLADLGGKALIDTRGQIR